MKTDDRIPLWVWRGAIIMLAGALILIIVLLAVTLLGIADPKPIGVLAADDHFSDMTQWTVVSISGHKVDAFESPEGYEVEVAAGESDVFGLFAQDITPPMTIAITASQSSGGTDAAYGLWWEEAGHTPGILFGVNSDKYMGIMPFIEGSGAPIHPWQPFPHVRPVGETNVFRADFDKEHVTLRLNDEVAAIFDAPDSRKISAGFFIRASQHDRAVIRFVSFKVWLQR